MQALETEPQRRRGSPEGQRDKRPGEREVFLKRQMQNCLQEECRALRPVSLLLVPSHKGALGRSWESAERRVLAVCDVYDEEGAGAKGALLAGAPKGHAQQAPEAESLPPPLAAAGGGCENPLSPGALGGEGAGNLPGTETPALGLRKATVGLGLRGAACMEGTRVTAGTVIVTRREPSPEHSQSAWPNAGRTVTNLTLPAPQLGNSHRSLRRARD